VVDFFRMSDLLKIEITKEKIQKVQPPLVYGGYL
jgi:hypothetical protein